MYEIRSPREEEFSLVLDLINSVFVPDKNAVVQMHNRFPLMLSKDNIANIKIICQNDMPVSVSNYYITTIMSEGFPIKVASIGAVCTNKEYRGKGLSSMILEVSESQMKEQNVDIVLVSGTRSLYMRRGCAIVGGFIESKITPETVKKISAQKDISICDFNETYFSALLRLYNREHTRFYRTFSDFKTLLQAILIPDKYWDNKCIVIKKRELIVGYVAIQVDTLRDSNAGEILEYAGEREYLFAAFPEILQSLTVKELSIQVPEYDPLAVLFRNNGMDYTACNQLGTVKILQPETFVKKMEKYFLQYISKEEFESLSINENNGIYNLNYNNESIKLSNYNLMTEVIFGIKNNLLLDEEARQVMNIDTENKCTADYISDLRTHPQIQNLIEKVLPIPLPWAGNLNYI